MAENQSLAAPLAGAAGRLCGGCTLCCYVLGVNELGKPKDVWCQHCTDHRGCGIYPFRPASCRDWQCAWLKYPQFPDFLYPKTAHVVINFRDDAEVSQVVVDPNFPDAWRAEPVYAFLKNAALRAYAGCRLVIVQIGRRQIVLLPDRDLDLGVLSDAEELAFRWVTAGANERPRLMHCRHPVGSGAPPQSAWQDATAVPPAQISASVL